MNESVQKFLKANPQKVEIPNGAYDLSKESSGAKIISYNSALGNSWDTVGSLRDVPVQTSPQNACLGISKNGRAFVQVGTEQLGLDGLKQPDFMFDDDVTKKGLTSITLYSDDANFTPAQKNLIAIAHQKLGHSQNSMISGDNRLITTHSTDVSEAADGCTHMEDVLIKDFSLEDFFARLSRWAQDINPDDAETQKILGGLSSLKAGEGIIHVPKVVDETLHISKNMF